MNINLNDNDYNVPMIVQTIEVMFNTIIEADPDDSDEAIQFISAILDGNIIDINTHYDYEDWTYGGGWDNFLKTAVRMFNTEIIQLLLDFGINVNIKDTEGLTPLDIFNQEFEENGHHLTLWLQDYMKIRNILLENGAMTREQLRQRGNNSDPDSIPSDPDINLLRNEAARNIQRRMRGRQERQRRKLTQRRYGKLGSNPTRRERMRRFTEHARRMTLMDDELAGYLYPFYYDD
jgi:hypothetical protein